MKLISLQGSQVYISFDYNFKNLKKMVKNFQTIYNVLDPGHEVQL